MFAEPAAVFGIAFRQYGFNFSLTKLMTVGLRVVRPISLDPFGTASRSAWLATYRRDRVDQRQQLGYVMLVCSSYRGRKRDTLSVGDDMVFTPRFASICRVSARFFPPCTARTDAESTKARDQSSLSASFKCASSVSWTRCQTPRLRHASNRRQAVIPLPQPNSFGNISHGIPERSTKIIAHRTLRFSNGFRPGYRLRRLFGGGNTGSIKSHNASSKIGLAMTAPPCAAQILTDHN
jgi:hypothetical protein